MNNLQKLTLVAAAVAGSLVWWYFAKSTKSVNNVPTIHVGTSADFPPFEFVDTDGTIRGYDIDVIKLIMEKIGRPYRLTNMPFDTLLPQAQLGAIQIVCSGLSVTQERQQFIHMSKPYVPQEPVVLIHPVTGWHPTTMHDLHDKHIIINNGYNTDLLIQQYPGIHLVRTPSPAEAILALTYHKGDGFLIGAFAAQEILTKQPADRWEISPLDVPLAPMAVGVSMQYPELLEEVNAALDALEASGELTALQQKWGLLP